MDVEASPDLDMMGYFRELLLSVAPGSEMFSPVHCRGVIILTDVPMEDKDSSHIDINPLFDTGALAGSYLAQTFIDKYPILKNYLRNSPGVVFLADNKTKVPVAHILSLQLKFSYAGTDYYGVVDFRVLPTCSNDLIIGLPAIIRYFGQLLKDMLQNAFDKLFDDHLHNMVPNSIDDLVEPWSTQFNEEAVEDLETPLPCSFAEALHFLEMTYDEAVDEYIQLFDTHIDKDFLAYPGVHELMMTKGLKCFVHSDWTGINGLKPYEIKMKPGFPDSLRPKARPINPKLYEHAYKEFQRLQTYFYEPSDSPVASPLVIAPKNTAPCIRFCVDLSKVNQYIEIANHPIPILYHEI